MTSNADAPPPPMPPPPSALLASHLLLLRRTARPAGGLGGGGGDNNHGLPNRPPNDDDDEEEEEERLLSLFRDVLRSLSNLDGLPHRCCQPRSRRRGAGGRTGGNAGARGTAAGGCGGGTGTATATVVARAEFMGSVLFEGSGSGGVGEGGGEGGRDGTDAAGRQTSVGATANEDESEEEEEWAAGLTLIRLVLGLPRSIGRAGRAGRDDDESQQSEAGAESCRQEAPDAAPATPSPPLPPHLILRTVLDRSLDLGEEEEEHQHRQYDLQQNQQYDTQRQQQQRRPASPTAGCSSVAVTLILTGTAALRMASCQTRSKLVAPSSSSNGVGKVIRWRRLSSMVMETVELYQRSVLRPLLLLLLPSADSSDRGAASVEEAAMLLTQHLLPAARDLLETIEMGAKSGGDKSAASAGRVKLGPIAAGLVSCVAGVVRLLHCRINSGGGGGDGGGRADGSEDNISSSDRTAELLGSISTLPAMPIDAVLLHPVRRWVYERSSRERGRHGSALDDEDDEDDGDGDDDSTSLAALTCKSTNLGGGGDLCGMETNWDGVGIAYLAYRTLSFWFHGDSSLPASTSRPAAVELLPMPCAYSPRYLFAMLYPHVEILLALGQGDYDEGEDSEGGADARTAAAAAASARAHTRAGVNMLRFVLRATPPSSSADAENSAAGIGSFDSLLLTGKAGAEGAEGGQEDADTEEGPLGPVGTVQLLLNLAVSLSGNQGDGGPTPSNATNANHRGESAATVSLSRSEIVSLIRDLLDRYSPLQRVRSVGKLLERCPYPFLIPILLDMLRPALLSSSSTPPPLPALYGNGGGPQPSSCCDGAAGAGLALADEIEVGTLDVLDPYLKGMGRYVPSAAAATATATTSSDGKLPSSESGLLCSDLDGLMDSVEPYACAASLVRLLCLRRLKRPRSVSFGSTAEEFSTRDGGCYADYSDLDCVVDVLTNLHRRLASRLEVWSKLASGMEGSGSSGDVSVEASEAPPPPDFYRLYLLEDALAEVVRTGR